VLSKHNFSKIKDVMFHPAGGETPVHTEDRVTRVIDSVLQDIHTQLNYPEIVKRILREYADYYTEDSTHPLRLLVDDAHKSYMLLDIGWYGHKYIHHIPIYVDIIDGKIWVQ
jgi:hypothetical protein